MDSATVRSAIIDTVRDIQTISGYDGAGVSGGVCPLKDLPGFDSMICAEATSMVASVLGIAIADNINIFVSDNGKQPLTIDESAAVICERLNTGET